MKTLCKYAGIVLALTAIGTLSLPLFRADGTMVRMYNLAGLSPWGAIALLVPIATLCLGVSRLNTPAKSISLLSLLLLNGAAISGAVSAARQWIHTLSDGFVQPYGTQWLYAALASLSLVFFWIATHLPERNPAEEAELIAREEAESALNSADINTECIIKAELYRKEATHALLEECPDPYGRTQIRLCRQG